MSKKFDIAFATAIVAYFAIFFGIIVTGHHYIMFAYYMMNGPVSEVYPHYFTTEEAIVVAAIGGILTGFIAYFLIGLVEKMFPGKGNIRKIQNSGMPQ